MGSNATLGQRNNNPLNIRYNRLNKWNGQVGENKGFCVFSEKKYGYRASFILLRTYSRRGINTIREIINTWAPPTENNTVAYIRYVSEKTGIPADMPLSFSFENLAPVVMAMAQLESNIQATYSELEQAFKMV